MNLIIKKNHNISQRKISKNSMKVLYRLNKSGYEAYLVGGGVRDLLLSKKPKDFDIATNAKPNEIRKLFKNCRLIGRRFIIAHLIFKNEIIEVSTFRAKNNTAKNHKLYSPNIKKSNNGMLLCDNNFGKVEEDAYRRDLTINALYYSIKDSGIRDYIGGIKDIKQKIIRLIGDAETRYREDPVRMLRVVRFSVRLNMYIDKKTEAPINKLSKLLTNIPPARLFTESIKLFCFGYGYLTYIRLRKYSLVYSLLPFLLNKFSKKNTIFFKNIIIYCFKKVDFPTTKKKLRCPEFLFASLLWYPLIEKIKKLLTRNKLKYLKAYSMSVHYILKKYSILLGIPKNILLNIEKIWNLQKDIETKKNCENKKIIQNNIFFQALELISLRSRAENQNELKKILFFWNKKIFFLKKI
ncbi:Poly(A) polymerase I [Buchnera aphidicola (Cinara kochiana kochiana)]|uniref:Poly(A) polymerase I n=1 Tax=Buchnera aphidicola (Cinara kochiana kochiana) TaxID=2518976 RepID=A0A451D5G5_9GAMM|nr:polynucleotide adenylyltransferase PcnB [Buchnera aphidicola]VFP81052.1 Poly(A) polymerase I [Buchnera aphidicola (Cinara kochiana kochiana)]